MKKNLLNEESVNGIIKRINDLLPETKNHWGEMNPTEMLYHCNLCNLQLFEETEHVGKPSLKQRFLKIVALYIVPRFPKNRKGAERNRTRGKIATTEFALQLEQFKIILKRFSNYQQPITLIHPAFGPLTNNEWGIAAWKHLDHHLRQFGL
jgi:hypothetical protein